MLVGVSATFGLYTEEYIAYSERLRSKSQVPIVWGGVHAGSVYELCMKKDYIDFVIMGEGEVALFELAETLRKNGGIENARKIVIGGFDKVRNLVYKNNDRFYVNNEIPVTENDIDIFPLDLDLMPNYEAYIETVGKDRIFHALQTSRGCPFNCTFCYNNQFNQRKWRKHSVERILSDVAAIRERVEFNKIRFVDDLFFTHKKRAKEIISRLYNEMGIAIFAPDARLDNLDDEMCEFLLAHDCTTVFVGTESEDDELLKVMNKQMTHKRMIERFTGIKKYPELTVSTGFILAIPAHTEAHIKKSIDFALAWQRKIPNLKIGLETYLPFPGTDMYKDAVSNGYPDPERLEFYRECYSSSLTGKFPKFKEMEWLKASPKFKSKLNNLAWISGFYSGLITPPNKTNLKVRIYNHPFIMITYFRLKFLITSHYQIDQNIHRIEVEKIVAIKNIIKRIKGRWPNKIGLREAKP